MCEHVNNKLLDYTTEEIIKNLLKPKKDKFLNYEVTNLVCKECEEIIFREFIEIY